MRRGPIIILEGMVGCGKTTQLKVVENFLRERNIPSYSGREPGGSPLAEKIRRLILDPDNTTMTPLTETLLFEAARAQFYAEIVIPHIERGEAFLSDRSLWSTEIFQGFGKGVDRRKIQRYNTDAVLGFLPDITYLLDIENVEAAVQRARAATHRAGEKDKFEGYDLRFHYTIRDGYRILAQENPEKIVRILHYEEETSIPERISKISTAICTNLSSFLTRYYS